MSFHRTVVAFDGSPPAEDVAFMFAQARALLGSVSEALTEGATHPVLITPRRPQPVAETTADLETTEAR